MKRTELLDDLKARTLMIVDQVAEFKLLSSADLNKRITPTSWSILECLEHLSRYGNFYLPEIKNRIRSGQISDNEEFKSGWLGNYFALSMLPGENGKLNKMKTFKNMNPIHQDLNSSVIDKFLEQQHQLLQLIERSRRLDLSKTKTAISISKWIKLRLGDTLRVVIYHNQRHVKQANGILGEKPMKAN